MHPTPEGAAPAGRRDRGTRKTVPVLRRRGRLRRRRRTVSTTYDQGKEAQLMAGVRKRPQSSGKYQVWFIDMDGRRKYFVGLRSRPETLRRAQRLEDEHRHIRLGYRPPPHPSDRHQTRLLTEVVPEYLAWGQLQGGRRRKRC